MMYNKILRCFLLIVFFYSAELFAQGFNKEEKSIHELQDKRTLGKNNELLSYLKSNNNDIVSKTLITLANIADTNTIDVVSGFLFTHTSPKVRSSAAFSLGEMPTAKSSDYLSKALSLEKDKSVIIEILNNLGKTGDENALDHVCSYESSDDEINGAIALSIARFSIRKIRNENSINKLISLVNSIHDPEQQKYIAFAFNRFGDKNLLSKATSEINMLCPSPFNETKMWAYSALGKLPEVPAEILKSGWLNDEHADWRIKVAILNSTGNISDPKDNIDAAFLDAILQSAINETNDNVSITALQIIGRLFYDKKGSDEQLKKIKDMLESIITPDKAYGWQIKAEAIKTLAKIFKDEYKSSLFALYSAADNYDIKDEIIRSFQFMDSALVYKEIRDSISADVQRYNVIHPNKDGSMIGSEDLAKIYRAFVETLSSLAPKVDEENKNNIRLMLTEFTSSRNTAIVDVCLTALQDSIFSAYNKETAQILLFDFPEMKAPKDMDAMILYIQAMGNMKVTEAAELLKKNLSSEYYDIAKESADALKKITGKDFIAQIKTLKYRTDFDWDFMANFEDFKTATVNTTAGKIKILLLYKDAPFTSMNFVKLAMKHYFDNIPFHRVVPNFVIQGGDPQGTGYGGPGYSIRSEFTPMKFETGMVGMASSGKDTEGSQFFITHSPQYHLDGKYTIFGKVIEGMESVDKIQIGDKINSVTFSSE